MQLIVWHLEAIECLDGQDVEPSAAVDEGLGDLHIANDWGTQHGEGASGGCVLELVCRVEGDGTLGPPERARYLKLGEDCIHFTRKLLEDTLRGWGLGSAQDAGDSAWLPEDPSPLVLMVVIIPSGW